MALGRTIKPNHNGAKNGGGAWCTRAYAKTASRKLGRREAKEECRQQLNADVRPLAASSDRRPDGPT